MTGTSKHFTAQAEKTKSSLELDNDFAINPKKFYCQKHPKNEIEFCSEVSGKFYCKRCMPEHKGHNDKNLHAVAADLQKMLIDIRALYFSKKNTLVTKVHNHLGQMESVFKVYYDALDKLRYEMLGEEYEYLAKMDGLETRLTRTVKIMKNYNIMEFFNEEKELREQL